MIEMKDGEEEEEEEEESKVVKRVDVRSTSTGVGA